MANRETPLLKYTKQQVLGFNENDWIFRRSSGYAGYDPIQNPYSNILLPDESKWIYEREFNERKRLKLEYEYDYKLISEFRIDCLPLGAYPDYVIQEFLNAKYFKNEN